MNKIINKVNKERQSVKSYNDEKISNEDFKDILSTIYWSPSSLGFEPYRVIVINKNHKLREELRSVMWNQGTITESDKLLLFISLKSKVFKNEEWVYKRCLRKINEIDGKTGVEAEEAAKKSAQGMMGFLSNPAITDDWAMKQAYIALGMGMYSASILNIGSTPIEGFDKDKTETILLREGLINADENMSLVLALGYPKDKKSYSHWGTGKRVRDKWEDKFKEI